MTHRSWWIAIWLVLLPRLTAAQIVNVQGALAKPPEHDGTTAQLELKIDWREGNNSLFDVGGSGTVLVKRGKLLALAIARGEYGRGAGTTFKQKSFEHVRARYTLDRRWRWEAFAQHESDRFRRLTVRGVVGTGPALQLVRDDHVNLHAGLAYMLEIERFDDRDGTTDAGARFRQHRASFYLTGTQKISETVEVVETVYVQPRIDEPSDVRLLGEISITTKLSKHIALTDGFTVAYDRTPPEGIKRFDTQLRVALLITF